jgi:hypothetical protein
MEENLLAKDEPLDELNEAKIFPSFIFDHATTKLEFFILGHMRGHYEFLVMSIGLAKDRVFVPAIY